MSYRIGNVGYEEDSLYTIQSLSARNFNYEYELLKQLGQGGFGCVWQARRSSDKVKVAVKIYFKKCADRQMAVHEMKTLKILNHPNIVRFIDYFEDDMCCFICMEQISGGELFYRIARGKVHTEMQARHWCTSLLSAVGYCHSQGIIHRDIKPENIMMVTFQEASDIKLVDFGLSVRTTSYPYSFEEVGTKNYKAPEMNAGTYYNTKVDLWSVGVIAFLLLGGYLPFSITSTNYDIALVFENKPSIWNKVSIEAKSFISRLLVLDPRMRLTASQALNHRWFGVNAEEIGEQDLKETLIELRQFNAHRKVEFWIKAWLAKKCAKKWIQYTKNRQQKGNNKSSQSSETDTNEVSNEKLTTIKYSVVDPSAAGGDNPNQATISGEIEVPFVYTGLEKLNSNCTPLNSSSSVDSNDDDHDSNEKKRVKFQLTQQSAASGGSPIDFHEMSNTPSTFAFERSFSLGSLDYDGLSSPRGDLSEPCSPRSPRSLSTSSLAQTTCCWPLSSSAQTIFMNFPPYLSSLQDNSISTLNYEFEIPVGLPKGLSTVNANITMSDTAAATIVTTDTTTDTAAATTDTAAAAADVVVAESDCDHTSDVDVNPLSKKPKRN